MWTERRSVMTLLGTFALIGAGFMLLAWPPYKNAAAINRTIDIVHMRVQNHEQEMESLQSLAKNLNAMKATVESDLRAIPGQTDMASLIKALTVEVDHLVVYDQTFSTGKVQSIMGVSDGGVLALPLTIDMDATFAVVFDVISRVERMSDLVRVAKVQVERHADHDHLVRATIELDAAFEVAPPRMPEGEPEKGAKR